jgi:hypothetical protein
MPQAAREEEGRIELLLRAFSRIRRERSFLFMPPAALGGREGMPHEWLPR